MHCHQFARDLDIAKMASLAFALTAARIKKLESELRTLDENLQDLLKNVKRIEERKRHLKQQLQHTVLQTTYIKRLIS